MSLYEWLNHPISNRDQENIELTKMIKEIFTQSRNVYGARRIAKKLAMNRLLSAGAELLN